MKVTLKTGILFAFAWMIAKLIIHFSGWSANSVVPTIFLNMLFLLSAICTGLYLHKKQEGFSQGNAMSDIKASMTTGIPYAMLVAIFIYFYYAQINPEYVQHQIADAERTIQIALDDPTEMKRIRAEQEAFEVMSKEKIYAELVKGPRSFYSAGSTMTIGLLGMVMLATMYSILVTVIYRRVLFRDRLKGIPSTEMADAAEK
jgi:hypothetical protein